MVVVSPPVFGQLAPFSWTLLVFGRAPACWRDLGCYATARVVGHYVAFVEDGQRHRETMWTTPLQAQKKKTDVNQT